RDPPRARVSGVGDPSDFVARGLLRRAARWPAREDAVRLRRARWLHHRGVAGTPEQERARPRGGLGDEADEGQGVRARRQARGSARRCRTAWPAARGAHHQRDRVHACQRRGPRLAGQPVSVPFAAPLFTTGSERALVVSLPNRASWLPEESLLRTDGPFNGPASYNAVRNG